MVLKFVIIFITSCFLSNSSLASSHKSDFYQQGLAQRDSGNWAAALKIWLAAKDSMNQPDPRIGLAFIELATQKQATAYYDEASALYFWGLPASKRIEFKNEMAQEIERISPLLNETDRAAWFNLLENGDGRLYNEIKGFWLKNDPIPTTEINERLLEHWERIAHAREKFKMESTTVYGSDDRGLVFIKYGAPDEDVTGNLGSDQLEIMRWLDDFQLRQEIQRFNNNPDFEVWVYKKLKKGESTIFIFGKRGGFARYGLRYGLEDLIPERAFRRSSMQTTRGVLPGAMLQLMYYSQLLLVDRFFLERYRELETLWQNARAGGRLSPDYEVIQGLLGHYHSKDQANAEFRYVPPAQSDALEGLEPLDLKYKLFRYLDNQHRPRLSLMVVSDAREVDDADFSPFFAVEKSSRLKQRHILVTYDSYWNTNEKIVDYPALQNTNTSTFFVKQTNFPTRYILVAEKVQFEIRKQELQETDIPDTAKVVGSGSRFLGEIAPLSADTTQLEISDAIVGVLAPEPVGFTERFAFPVMPRDPVKHSEPLRVYVEFYHLNSDEFNTAINIQCQIKRIKEKGKLDKQKEQLSASFNFEAFESTTSKIFELDISTLIPGDYEFTLIASRENSKHQKIREAAFRVVE